jgi:hypothetical protein
VDEPMAGAVRRGEVLTVGQRSVRRRDYGLRRGDRDLGRLRFAPGRRSLAQAETAAQGLLRSWVQITVQQDLPEQAAVLLSVVGGFLALRELQAEVDASAAVGGIVAGAG